MAKPPCCWGAMSDRKRMRGWERGEERGGVREAACGRAPLRSGALPHTRARPPRPRVVCTCAVARVMAWVARVAARRSRMVLVRRETRKRRMERASERAAGLTPSFFRRALPHNERPPARPFRADRPLHRLPHLDPDEGQRGKNERAERDAPRRRRSPPLAHTVLSPHFRSSSARCAASTRSSTWCWTTWRRRGRTGCRLRVGFRRCC